METGRYEAVRFYLNLRRILFEYLTNDLNLAKPFSLPMTPLPEKVLQFGTGILLRGLPDYFIDQANRRGIFSGRILVVKSTAGTVEDFERHHFKYTTCVRGINKGKEIEENVLNTAISRVVSAQN